METKNMNGKKKMRALSLLFTALIVSVILVQAVSAEKTSPRIVSEWEKEHTILVEHTTEYYVSDETLYVKDIYSGSELKKRFNVEKLEKTNSYKVDPDYVKKFDLVEGKHYTSTESSYEVFTLENDPPVSSKSYDYPQWIYEKLEDTYHQLDEPINIAWESNDLNTVKPEILNEGWWDVIAEDTYYIYDSGWKADDGLASDPLRVFGGWHIRLWQMNDGDVVGAAHHDTWAPHEADGFENAEEEVAGFYDQAGDDMWHVYEDDYSLDNYVASPYNNGMCTRIFYG